MGSVYGKHPHGGQNARKKYIKGAKYWRPIGLFVSDTGALEQIASGANEITAYHWRPPAALVIVCAYGFEIILG